METTTTTPKNNIFANAKKAEPKKQKEEKKTITIDLLDGKVLRFNELKGLIDALEAEKKMLEGDIKDVGKKEFCAMFTKLKVKPESFVIEDRLGGRVLYMVVDKYLTVTPEKKEIFEEVLPSMVETTTTFGFDPDVLSRNIEALSEAIQNANMSDEDKQNLIIASELTAVKKGAVDLLATTTDVNTSFELIAPIQMLKPQK